MKEAFIFVLGFLTCALVTANDSTWARCTIMGDCVNRGIE